MKTKTTMSHLFYQAKYSFRIKFFTLLCLVILADSLFYGKSIGVSAAIFLAALGLGIIITNTRQTTPGTIIRSIFILILATLPLIEDLNMLSATVSIYGIIYLVIQLNNRLSDKIIANLNYALQLIVLGIPRIIRDTGLSLKINRRLNLETDNRYQLLNWILPVICTTVFLLLFAKANPLIAEWLINFKTTGKSAIAGLNGKRIIFWTLIAIAIWPMIRSKLYYWVPRKQEDVKLSDETRKKLAEEYPSLPELLSVIVNEHSILRSLILFNLLFGLQSILDIAYLWNGVTLPSHLTYAEYSHRGAYPLIATALLAATFVLLALRPGSKTNENQIIRSLVYIWILQNILLVTSSILRLNLYIDVYQLTYLRVAAFIWMGLVAIGLASIILRVALNKSNNWLIRFNFTTLRITLYVCCFINFGHIIASYNIAHNDHSRLDAKHLCSIGKAAIPSIIKISTEFEKNNSQKHKLAFLRGCTEYLIKDHDAGLADWRSWGYRSQRLSIYLKELKNANSVKQAAP